METLILNYFLTISKLGTISAAARELHVSQPTLSRQIQQLESQLETPLFTREKHRMILTKAGAAYQIHVQQILTELDRANQLVLNINNNELTGTISIGSVESSITKFLIPEIGKFYHKNPGVIFNMYDADGTEIKQKIDQGLLELGLVSTPIDTAKYHYLEIPIKDTWGIAVAEDNPLIKYDSVNISDLKELPLIIPHRQLVRDELNDWLNPDGNQLKIVAEYNLLTNAIYFAEAKMGILICIQGVELPKRTTLKFIPFDPVYQLRHFLIWRKNSPLSDVAQAFLNQLKSQLTIQ